MTSRRDPAVPLTAEKRQTPPTHSHDTTTALEPARAASARVVELLAGPITHDYADVALHHVYD